MGGFGSGRPRTKATTSDFVRWAWKDCFGPSINRIKPIWRGAELVIGPHQSTWTREHCGTEIDRTKFGLHLRKDGQHFLRMQHSAGIQDIQLEWLPRHFGGGRWVLRCPYTGRRCWVLYRPTASTEWGFASRHNWCMNYAIENMDPLDRATCQLFKIRQQLRDAELNLIHPTKLLAKPRGMHWKTYKRLIAQAEKVEERRLRHMVAAFSSLTRGCNRDFDET